MRDHGDPQSDGNSRNTKLVNRRPKTSQSKKSQKVARRSLSSELSSTEDASKELAEISSISEALDANPDGEITEITDESADIALESFTSNYSKISLGVDESADLLITAQKQVLESLDANCQSQKFLDSLTKYNLDKYSKVSEERAPFDGLIRRKVCAPFLCLLFGILLVVVFSSGSKGSYGGTFPT